MGEQKNESRLVGADRVIATLVALASYPEGVSLDELSTRLNTSKSTVHRALTSLRRARLATQVSRGVYILGDELIRLVLENYAARPEAAVIEPILQRLAEHFGETTHYAVLDGNEVVYRAKVDPPTGGVRLTSIVGGRNPAHSIAVGKLLLSQRVGSEAELEELFPGGNLERKTPNTIDNIPALWAELRETRKRGFAVDNQENELGVNCLAVPIPRDILVPEGAISVSALAFRTPLKTLVQQVPAMLAALHDEPIGASLAR